LEAIAMTSLPSRSADYASLLVAAAALTAGAGCSSTSPPFDKMKDSQMTVYRLQNFEPPQAAPTPVPAAAPPPDAPRFHNFRILEWRPITDSGTRSDIVDLFGHQSNFQSAGSSCLFAEFGFAMAQPTSPTPADVLVSLSCEQVLAFNFAWPYAQTGLTPDSSKKVVAIAQRVFTGR
jgi:hypothetical protein